jgi:hypothetical protein
MVNRPRIKGTFAETAVVGYLQLNGWPYAERRALKGATDRGDVAGCPGLCIEVKYAGTARDAGTNLRIGSWLTETGIERLNAGADYGILVVKPPGVGERFVGSWYAVMMGGEFERLRNGVTFIEGGPIVQDGDPQTYSAATLRWSLNAGLKRLGSNELLALTLRPPGTKDNPELWYRVMSLEQMVRLLRAAGYGEPLPAVLAL